MQVLRFEPARIGGALQPLAWAIALLDMIAAWLIVALLSVMVAVVAAQVVLRYGLNSSIGWADEISRLAFVWTMFLAIPLGIRHGAHIGIELVTDRLAPPLRSVLSRLMALLAAAMMALLAWETLKLAAEQWDEMMSSLRYSSSWFIVPLAICGVHGGLHMLWIALTGPAMRDSSLPPEPA